MKEGRREGEKEREGGKERRGEEEGRRRREGGKGGRREGGKEHAAAYSAYRQLQLLHEDNRRVQARHSIGEACPIG